ncbi:MAG: NADH-dependent alcohol dehydrogenase [Deltaproteobacteria bacterium HGW-Deltaproteobacteria-17]|nr:MAG: NADH-dependent alcohol dehydrogenase [Deltaproteobacteria bacterium HGW-Deltaproteobacteria-17]
MLNFTYYNPVRLIFGPGSLDKLRANVPADGPVMLVSGGESIRKNGVREAILGALTGMEVVEFTGVEPNPQLDTLLRAVDVARRCGAKFLLAAGGGSVIDGTKFIAATVPYTGDDPWQLVTGREKIREALPLGVVLTLPGTASEMNDGAVVSRRYPTDKQPFRSEKLYPKFAILDPAFTLSLPWRYTANGIADAFVHVMEQYCTRDVFSPLQDRIAEGILATLVACGPMIKKNPNDLAVRGEIMWCATMALNRLVGCGVVQDWSTHLIGHALTAEAGMDHARSLTVVLPWLLRDRIETKRGKLAQLGRRVFNVNMADDHAAAGATIEAIEAFFTGLEVPVRLDPELVTEEVLQRVLGQMSVYKKGLGENQDITPAVVERILRASLGK